MNRGPIGGVAAKDHVEKVRTSWGSPAPWLIVLAEQCNKASQSAVAKELGYSGATISQVLSNSYRGDLGRIEDMVSGRYMAATVNCPVLGELGRNTCLEWQAKPYAATSSHRVMMYRACRAGCAHSNLRSQGDDNETR